MFRCVDCVSEAREERGEARRARKCNGPCGRALPRAAFVPQQRMGQMPVCQVGLNTVLWGIFSVGDPLETF